MKTKSLFFPVLVIMLLSSCIKQDFDVPPVVVPSVDFESNTTIADLKAMYSGSGVDSLDSNLIIQGIVTANDETGNIYKSIFIQDATGGIEISIDKYDMYATLKVGQKLYVKCAGLYLGTYGDVVKLGYLYNGALGRIPDALYDAHFFRDSLPGTQPSPISRQITTINTSEIGMLVKLEGVHILEAGLPYADASGTTNRTIEDANGNTIILRNSNYATFAATPMPSGEGSITGILSAYAGDYQFYIRSESDINFAPDNSFKHINEAFATSLNTFTGVSVSGNESWYWSSFSPKTFAKISGFVGSVGYVNEDWLISSEFNLDITTGEILKFESAMKFGLVGDGSLKVMFTNAYTGDPATTTWQEIIGATLSTGNYTFTQSGDLDVSALTGTACRIAFKYTCGTTDVPTWEITNVVLKGTLL